MNGPTSTETVEPAVVVQTVNSEETKPVEKKDLDPVEPTPSSVQPPPSPEIPTPSKAPSNENDEKKELKPPQSVAMENTPSTTSLPERSSSVQDFHKATLDRISMEIRHKREMLKRMDEELFYLRHVNGDLTEKIRLNGERMSLRKKDQKQLVDNYNEHLRSRRATDDDAESIRQKLLELKGLIKHLSTILTEQCDPVVATKAVTGFWINLHQAILSLGDPLPKPRIEMLIEKFLMDVLIQNMNYNNFTGLKISSAYTQLQKWFERYEPSFCTRFRQEIAKTVVTENVPGSDIRQELEKFSKRVNSTLYSSLSKAFPFMEKQDAEQTDPKKNYGALLTEMVDLASRIGYAMRGQEVEIAAAAVGEGTEPLDLSKMVDEDGQTSGIIQLCISPPFILYGNRVTVLEKARVLCSRNDTVSS